MADLPEEGSPSRITCFAGVEREDDTESKMEDHRSCGNSSGDDERDTSIVKLELTARARRESSDSAGCLPRPSRPNT